MSDRILSFRSAVAESNYRDTAWGVTKTPVTVSHITSPTAALDRQRRTQFEQLANQWSADTVHMSSLSDMVAHPAYQAIIAMGMPAIGLLLEQLRKEPDFWFEALRRISAVDPVRQEDIGDLVRMTQAWLDWGTQQGYV
jgi:hypothetical protein